MAARTFPIDNLPSPGNAAVRQFAARIECSKCGVKEHYSKPRATSWMAVEQRFRKLGWHVGNGPRADLCPGCQKTEKPQLRVVENHITSEKLLMEHSEHSKLVVDPPREMGRDDRRVIFAKIDENWLSGGEGYAAPWTDASIARDLGVPVAWVAQVRDDMFGPAGTNPEIEMLIAKHEEGVKAFRDVMVAVNELVQSAASLNKRIEEIGAAFKGRQNDIDRIRKAVGK